MKFQAGQKVFVIYELNPGIVHAAGPARIVKYIRKYNENDLYLLDRKIETEPEDSHWAECFIYPYFEGMIRYKLGALK